MNWSRPTASPTPRPGAWPPVARGSSWLIILVFPIGFGGMVFTPSGSSLQGILKLLGNLVWGLGLLVWGYALWSEKGAMVVKAAPAH